MNIKLIVTNASSSKRIQKLMCQDNNNICRAGHSISMTWFACVGTAVSAVSVSCVLSVYAWTQKQFKLGSLQMTLLLQHITRHVLGANWPSQHSSASRMLCISSWHNARLLLLNNKLEGCIVNYSRRPSVNKRLVTPLFWNGFPR